MYRNLDLRVLGGPQVEFPASVPFAYLSRRWRHFNDGLAQQIIEPAITKGDRVVFEQRSIELAMFFPPDTTHLENVSEIGIKPELHRQLNFRAVEIQKGEAVEKNLGAEQLLATDVDRVFREIEGLAQGGTGGGKLNLRNEGLFCAGGKHNSMAGIDVELQMAQKSGVAIEEADVGCSRRSDIPG